MNRPDAFRGLIVCLAAWVAMMLGADLGVVTLAGAVGYGFLYLDWKEHG